MEKLVIHLATVFPVIAIFSSFLYWIITGEFIGIKIGVVILVMGFLLNGILKMIMKYYFPKVDVFMRPNPPKIGCNVFTDCDQRDGDYGMPSGHMQSATLFAMLWTMVMLRKKGGGGGGGGDGVRVLILWIIAAIVGWSRVRIGCHNWTQVIVGGIIGGIIGLKIL